jgi:hypothetical protein
MARIEVDPNYSSPTFSRATAAADIFKKEDVQALAAAMSTHTHDGAGKGLAIAATGIPAGSITSAMIADGTIVAGDIADGTITSAKIADGTVATADVAGGAITGTTFVGLVNANTTTSGTTVVLDSGPFTTGAPNSVVVIDWHAALQSTVAAAFAMFSVRVDGGGWITVGRMTFPATASSYPMSLQYIWTTLAAGAHTFDVGWLTSSGTLSVDTAVTRTFRITEFKR